EADAEPARIATDLSEERTCRRRCMIWTRQLRTLDRIQHSRAVANRDADDVTNREAAPTLAAIGTGRRAGPRRLQPEHATCGGRNADRTATIGRMCERQDARCNRSSCATRRAAG